LKEDFFSILQFVLTQKMIEKTKAIVINSIKFGDTSLIATCYTETCGMKTYLLRGIMKSKRAKIKPAYFLPLMQLELLANHNHKGKLNSIRELQISNPYQSIHTNILKQTMALFIGEVLYHAIKEEEGNSELFQYLETALLWLDTNDSISNFHLLFLLNLTKFLGFYPDIAGKEMEYFDLMEGKFSHKSTFYTISGEKLILFRKLLGINFDTVHNTGLNAAGRQMILTLLIEYFELHLSGFKKPKSLNVLKTVFSSS